MVINKKNFCLTLMVMLVQHTISLLDVGFKRLLEKLLSLTHIHTYTRIVRLGKTIAVWLIMSAAHETSRCCK